MSKIEVVVHIYHCDDPRGVYIPYLIQFDRKESIAENVALRMALEEVDITDDLSYSIADKWIIPTKYYFTPSSTKRLSVVGGIPGYLPPVFYDTEPVTESESESESECKCKCKCSLPTHYPGDY